MFGRIDQMLSNLQRGGYDRATSRTNRIEAEAVAAEAVVRMERWLKMPEKERPTLGVITFNVQQQALILDLLDAARREKPELEWFFAENRVEPTIVSDQPTELVSDDAPGYRVTDLSAFRAEPDLFFEFAYRDTLKGMIEAVMDVESPLRADLLAQRIARAHGWLRTGGRIRDRIDLYLRGYDTTNETSGIFIWKKGQVVDVLQYRRPMNEEARRAITDIPLAELASVMIDNQDLLDMPDAAREMARLLGVERLAASARARLDEAIARARLFRPRPE